jgi:hypothetical protein
MTAGNSARQVSGRLLVGAVKYPADAAAKEIWFPASHRCQGLISSPAVNLSKRRQVFNNVDLSYLSSSNLFMVWDGRCESGALHSLFPAHKFCSPIDGSNSKL